MNTRSAVRVGAFIACFSLIACGGVFIVEGVGEYRAPPPPAPAPRESLIDLRR